GLPSSSSTSACGVRADRQPAISLTFEKPAGCPPLAAGSYGATGVAPQDAQTLSAQQVTANPTERPSTRVENLLPRGPPSLRRCSMRSASSDPPVARSGRQAEARSLGSPGAEPRVCA